MPCEHYKDALIESAATGAEPQGELRAHLAACPACRAAFAEEQSLFASIDTGLHAAVNVELPASLLPRVRARLDEASAPQRRWFVIWSPLAASVMLAMAFLLVRGGRHTVEPQLTASIPGPDNSSPSKLPPLSEHPGSPSPTKVTQVNRRRPAAAPSATTIDEPQVLVAAGQQRVVVELIRDLRHQEGLGEALIADARDHQFQNLQISPLEVNPLEVKPLSDVLQEHR